MVAVVPVLPHVMQYGNPSPLSWPAKRDRSHDELSARVHHHLNSVQTTGKLGIRSATSPASVPKQDHELEVIQRRLSQQLEEKQLAIMENMKQQHKQLSELRQQLENHPNQVDHPLINLHLTILRKLELKQQNQEKILKELKTAYEERNKYGQPVAKCQFRSAGLRQSPPSMTISTPPSSIGDSDSTSSSQSDSLLSKNAFSSRDFGEPTELSSQSKAQNEEKQMNFEPLQCMRSYTDSSFKIDKNPVHSIQQPVIKNKTNDRFGFLGTAKNHANQETKPQYSSYGLPMQNSSLTSVKKGMTEHLTQGSNSKASPMNIPHCQMPPNVSMMAGGVFHPSTDSLHHSAPYHQNAVPNYPPRVPAPHREPQQGVPPYTYSSTHPHMNHQNHQQHHQAQQRLPQTHPGMRSMNGIHPRGAAQQVGNSTGGISDSLEQVTATFTGLESSQHTSALLADSLFGLDSEELGQYMGPANDSWSMPEKQWHLTNGNRPSYLHLPSNNQNLVPRDGRMCSDSQSAYTNTFNWL